METKASVISAWLRAVWVVLAIALTLFMYHAAVTHAPAVILQRAGPQSPFERVSLPHHESGDRLPRKIAIYSMFIEQGIVGLRSLMIRRDDCIRSVEVNRVTVPLPQENRCYGSPPMVVFIKPYLKKGMNQIVIAIENKGGVYGLRVDFVPDFTLVLGYILIVALGALLAYRYAGLRGEVLLFCTIAIPYFLYWFLYNPNDGYAHDLGGHIGYIRHIRDNWAHPYEYRGGERWHPPTYYYLAAPVYTLGERLGMDPLTAVRLLSLLLYSIFFAFAVSTLRLVRQSTRAVPFYVAVLVLMFFPTSVLMATRVNNDIALYAAWSATFFYITRWYQWLRPADLRNALIATAVAVVVKSNSIIIVGIVGALVLLALALRLIPLRHLYSRPVAFGFVFLIIAGFVNVGRLIFADSTAGAVGLHFGGSGRDPSSISHYLTFSFTTLLTAPFRSNHMEPGFWPYVVRTMTFGEFHWRYPSFASVVVVAVLLVLVSTVLITATRLIAVSGTWRRELPLLVGGVLPFLGLAAFYHVKNWSVCQDFRFIFPVIVPICALYMRSLEAVAAKPQLRPLYWILLATGVTVVNGAVLFYMAQYLYA